MGYGTWGSISPITKVSCTAKYERSFAAWENSVNESNLSSNRCVIHLPGKHQYWVSEHLSEVDGPSITWIDRWMEHFERQSSWHVTASTTQVSPNGNRLSDFGEVSNAESFRCHMGCCASATQNVDPNPTYSHFTSKMYGLFFLLYICIELLPGDNLIDLEYADDISIFGDSLQAVKYFSPGCWCVSVWFRCLHRTPKCDKR